MPDTPSPAIFDRTRRTVILERSASLLAACDDAFLFDHMADELAERLAWVQRSFERALIIGPLRPRLADALALRDIPVEEAGPAQFNPALPFWQCEEDALLLQGAPYDLVLAIGTLDSVNDLPGALLLIRKLLRPDGLFLGSCLGAGSLSALKAALYAADEARGLGAAAHVHPQIDVRAAGDLLQRAGFVMPVADAESLTVRYTSLMRLVQDLRIHGWSNMLAGPRRYLGKAGAAAALSHFASQVDSAGKTAETFTLLQLSGWAPSPDQPKPARRGTATTSLASVLGKQPDRP